MNTSSNKKMYWTVFTLLIYSSLSILITYLAWFAINPENIFFLPGANAILGVVSFTALYWKLPNLYFVIVLIYALFILFILLLLKKKWIVMFFICLYYSVDSIFSIILLLAVGGMPAFTMLAIFSLLVDVIIIFQLLLLKKQSRKGIYNSTGDGTVCD